MATGLIGANTGATEVFDVKLRWRHGVSIAQTGFSLRRNAALLATPQDVANNVDTAMRPVLRGLLLTGDTYLGVDVLNPITKTGATLEPASVNGLLGFGTTGPAFICGVISLKSERRSRIGQGRMFLPMYLETSIDSDVFNNDGMSALNAFLAALMSNYTGQVGFTEFNLVNWHRALPADRPNGQRPGVPAVAATWYDVVSGRVNPIVSSLRSRKVGVGS